MKIFPDVPAGPPMYRGDRPNVTSRRGLLRHSVPVRLNAVPPPGGYSPF